MRFALEAGTDMCTFSNLSISLSVPLLGFFQLLHLLHVLPVHSPVIQLVYLDWMLRFNFAVIHAAGNNNYGRIRGKVLGNCSMRPV